MGLPNSVGRASGLYIAIFLFATGLYTCKYTEEQFLQHAEIACSQAHSPSLALISDVLHHFGRNTLQGGFSLSVMNLRQQFRLNRAVKAVFDVPY